MQRVVSLRLGKIASLLQSDSILSSVVLLVFLTIVVCVCVCARACVCVGGRGRGGGGRGGGVLEEGTAGNYIDNFS